jgi:hypothetical protein
MMTMPLFHVSHVARGSMLGPQSTFYLRVVAADPATALQLAQDALAGHGVDVTTGQWSVASAGTVANDEAGVAVAMAA